MLGARVTTLVTAVVLALSVTGCSNTNGGGAQTAPTPVPPSRAEGPNTTPTPPVSSPPPPTAEELRRAAAETWAAEATPRELAGQMLMVTVPGIDGALLRETMAGSGVGGFILMGANVPDSSDDLRVLTAALAPSLKPPPLIAIDEEGGVVKRLPWDTLPGADVLRSQPVENTTAAFRERAELLRSAGVNVNFGVVADVTADPHSFIYWRTLGDAPESAGARVAAAVRAERGTVASTLKHFPGHGVTGDDSHLGVPRTLVDYETWLQHDAVAFRAGIEAGAELLMFGHLIYENIAEIPASLAPEWYEIARTELGFEGVMITDDLAMLRASGSPEYQDVSTNAVTALAAGADIALVTSGMDAPGVLALVDRVTAAIESGELPLSRVREAAARVYELRLGLAASSSQQPSAARR